MCDFVYSLLIRLTCSGENVSYVAHLRHRFLSSFLTHRNKKNIELDLSFPDKKILILPRHQV